MYQLKPLRREAVREALAKAERYRLLNEPWHAESICLDILEVEPQNQSAVIILLLALTDSFDKGSGNDVARARDLVPRLQGEYERAYYSGIICERRASALLSRNVPGGGGGAFDLYQEAMQCYEQAEALRPPGNDDAILRWNACARILMSHPEVRPRVEEAVEQPLE
jgi:hypothetical protein